MVDKLEQKLTNQKNNRRRKIIGIVIGSVTALVVLAGVLAYWWLGGALSGARPSGKNGEGAEHFIDPPNKLNIVIMGVDSRPEDDDPGRSDTLLVMTIDALSREIAIVSVPRDTRVRIPGHGWDKINHAFMFGGAALTRQTTETFLGIPLDYYVQVDMKSFCRVIDAIGGVSIDVEKRMQYEDTWEHFVIDLKPGLQHMDGNTALQYVRYRDEEGDIGRVARQQKFIRAVVAEVSTPMIILKAPSIIREVFAALDTNIPMPLMFGIARKLKDGLSTGLKAYMVEGLPYYIDDISYWIPDVLKTRQKVAEIQGVSFLGGTQLAAQRMADDYLQNIPIGAHLDDGSYYLGMDKVQVKPRASSAPAVKSVAQPSTTPKTATPNTSPSVQNKEVAAPAKK